MSRYPDNWCKIFKKTDLLSQKWREFGEFWPKLSKISKMFAFTGSYCTKYLMFVLKKVQRSYFSWHWRVMWNLKKNWLVVWKMTWEIWVIFTTALQSVKIGILMGSFCSKQKIYEPKIYRGIMYHENEEWCKVWRGTDMSFQNWHGEFD